MVKRRKNKTNEQRNLNYYINRLNGNVLHRPTNDTFKTYSSYITKNLDLLSGKPEDAIDVADIPYTLIKELLSQSNSNVKINTAIILFHQLIRMHYNNSEKEELFEVVKSIIDTDIDIKVRAKKNNTTLERSSKPNF